MEGEGPHQQSSQQTWRWPLGHGSRVGGAGGHQSCGMVLVQMLMLVLEPNAAAEVVAGSVKTAMGSIFKANMGETG